MLRLTFLIVENKACHVRMQRYWLEKHAPIVAGHSQALGVLRYVQAHTTEDDHSRLTGRRGDMEEPYDGVAEVWWESREAMFAATRSDEGRDVDRILREDEEHFLDLKKSVAWFNYEYPQVNPTPENIVATERSSLVKLFPVDLILYLWRTPSGTGALITDR